MSRIINKKERYVLDRMELHRDKFHVRAELGHGIGPKTIQSLVTLGLIEAGASSRHYGEIGWRLTSDAWLCMYGKTLDEILTAGKPLMPLSEWRWPR